MQLMILTEEDYADRIISNNNAAPAANYSDAHYPCKFWPSFIRAYNSF